LLDPGLPDYGRMMYEIYWHIITDRNAQV
jgi:hypothetical protein